MDSRDKGVASDRPLLSVCLIVKNEENNLPRALASVRGVADEVIVVDTGSTDSTVDIAEKAGATVVRYEWADDFSEARNFALDRAHNEWVLQLDADEELSPVDPAHLASLLANARVDAYFCEIVNLTASGGTAGAIRHKFNRLFRRELFRYRGVVHEAPVRCAPGSSQWAWSGLLIVHRGYMDRRQAPLKAKRNRDLLIRAIERDPDNFLLYYYLGQGFMDSGRVREALKCFQKAESLRPVDTDSYQALLILRMCECLWRLNRVSEAISYVEQGIDRFPDYRDLLFLAGRLYEQVGETRSALRSYDHCVALPRVSQKYLLVREGLDKTAAERAARLRAGNH